MKFWKHFAQLVFVLIHLAILVSSSSIIVSEHCNDIPDVQMKPEEEEMTPAVKVRGASDEPEASTGGSSKIACLLADKDAKLMELTLRAKQLEAEKEALLQAAETRENEELHRASQFLRKMHSFAEIQAEAEEYSKSLPCDAYVPHIRSVSSFLDRFVDEDYDYPAVSAPSTAVELEQARAVLELCKPMFRIGKFGEDENIEDRDLAYQDRGKTGDIVISDVFVWGVERLKNREEAVFVTTVVIGHEKAHIVSSQNRYKGIERTPETFCSYTSRERNQV